MHRLRRFLASGDLSALGHLRYVQAERGRHATSFAALWSDGPLPLTTMFPARGDVPGSDLPEVPRPPGSQRLLVVEEAGEPLQLRVYRANGAAGRQGKTSVAAWANAYRSFLYSAGWRSSPAVTPTMAESTPSAQTWLAENSRQTKRSQRTLLVTAGQSSDRRPFVLLAVHPLADRDFVP